jgi:putative ubiquitin-RnfH superfamily antitoxin RatB of RatAB toxin-antitoxin module
MINVEIVYAQPLRTICKPLTMREGALIGEALAAVASDEDFRGVDLAGAPVGIFGNLASRDRPLKEGDRIEIYRPLLEEPKLARRMRAGRKASKRGRS